MNLSESNDRYHSDTTPLLQEAQNISRSSCLAERSLVSELKALVGPSVSLVGTYLLQYSTHVILILAASHLGTEQLAAMSVGITTMNITGYSIFEGLAGSLDTLCSQSFGSGKYHQVGVHVQQGILLNLLVCIWIMILWFLSPFIFPIFIDDPDFASHAGVLIRVAAFSLPSYAAFEAMKRFLQVQGDYHGGLVSLIVSIAVMSGSVWIFVYELSWGTMGAATALSISTTVRPIVLCLYIIYWAPSTLQCWPGLLAEGVFSNWRLLLRLAIPGAFMTLLEWLSFEIITLSTTKLGSVLMATQGLLVSMCIILWHVPFSVAVAVTTRVGILLGESGPSSVKRFLPLYAFLFLVIGLTNGSITTFGRFFISRVMDVDSDVESALISNMPFAALFQIFDSLSCFALGMTRGLGYQIWGAWIVLGVNYLWTVPASITLAMGIKSFQGLGLPGIWIGLASGQALITTLVFVMLISSPWRKIE